MGNAMDVFSHDATDHDYMEINPDGKNEVDLPYAAFRYGIRWKIDKIAGYKNARGYIVQKINISAPDYLRSFPVKEYFEAWEALDGKIKYPNNASSEIIDDCFSADESTAFESIGKKGQVIYQAKVYWIDYQDSLFEVVSKWEIGKVIQAGNQIRSIQRCADLDVLRPLFVRSVFIHNFDFANPIIIKDVALKFGRNFYSCPREYERDNFRLYYQDDFSKAGFRELFESVIAQLGSEFPTQQMRGGEQL